MSRRTVPWVSGFLLSTAVAGAARTTFAAGAPIPQAAGVLSQSVWKAVAASGPVTAREPGSPEDAWRRVVRGNHLPPLSEVLTGRRGRATLASHQSVLIVDPESRIELPATPSAADGQRVFQSTGSVVYEVDGSKVSDFRVLTPYLVAGVKGTVFLVTVKERYASVTVERGVVEVASVATDERAEIHAGETALVRAEEGAELEIVRPRGAEGKGREASREARKIARREVEKLEEEAAVPSDGDGGPVEDVADPLALGQEKVDPTGEGPLVDDPTDPLGDPLENVTDPLKDPLPDPTKTAPTDPLRNILD